MDWFKKNWFLCGVLAVAIIFAIGWVGERKDNKGYIEDITEKDIEIDDLNVKIIDTEKRADVAVADATKWESEAKKEAKELKKALAVSRRIRIERNGLAKKVAKMPPDEVVEKTRGNIGSDEVELREIGIVFSLVAAKKNLTILEDFTLCRNQVDTLETAVKKATGETEKTKKANVKLKKALTLKDISLGKWAVKEIKWDDKFNICEKQKRKNWFKGFAYGTAFGGGIILIIALLGGR